MLVFFELIKCCSNMFVQKMCVAGMMSIHVLCFLNKHENWFCEKRLTSDRCVCCVLISLCEYTWSLAARVKIPVLECCLHTWRFYNLKGNFAESLFWIKAKFPLIQIPFIMAKHWNFLMNVSLLYHEYFFLWKLWSAILLVQWPRTTDYFVQVSLYSWYWWWLRIWMM